MKKKNKLKILGAILIILIIGIGIYIWQTKANFLTPIEKEWLAASASKIQNIHVINNENIFGNDGQGLFYTFLKDFQDNYKISLNTITYKNTETVSGALFGASNYIPDDALEFYQDHYIYVTKKKEIVSEISGLRGKKIGVIKNDETLLNNRLAKININITTYNSQEELLQALEDEQVSSIIVPRIEYIDKILANDYYIGYHFSDINYYYYMNDVADSRLKSVMKKYFIDWEKHNLQKELAKEERAIFIKNLKIEEKDLVELQAVDVKYGLVNNSPYELLSGGKVGGIMTEYLKAFANFSGIEILYNRYDNPKKFIKEITNNKIKLYMNYFTQTNNGVEIPTNLTLSYSLYTHETNPLVVLTDASVKDKTIYVEENTLLATVLQQNYGYQIKTYNQKERYNISY